MQLKTYFIQTTGHVDAGIFALWQLKCHLLVQLILTNSGTRYRDEVTAIGFYILLCGDP